MVYMISTGVIERVSIERREIKIALNHIRRKLRNELIRNQTEFHLARGNDCKLMSIGFGQTVDWLTKWCELC